MNYMFIVGSVGLLTFIGSKTRFYQRLCTSYFEILKHNQSIENSQELENNRVNYPRWCAFINTLWYPDSNRYAGFWRLPEVTLEDLINHSKRNK